MLFGYDSPPRCTFLTRSYGFFGMNSFIRNRYLTMGTSQKLRNTSSYFIFVVFDIFYLPLDNPNSNGYAKHLVKTLKTATKTVRGDKQSLNQKIASCLLSYQPIQPTYTASMSAELLLMGTHLWKTRSSETCLE